MDICWMILISSLYLKSWVYCAINITHVDFLLNEIHSLKVYQVTIFTENSQDKKNVQAHSLLTSIAKEFPTVLLDMYEIKSSRDKQSLDMPAFYNPRRTTLYIILHNDQFHFKNLHDVLDSFTEISPTLMRPRCLVIFFNDNFSLENNLKGLLLYAWHLKFLDFTVLNVDSANQFLLLNYNPFVKHYGIEYSQTNMHLFPNKLTDVKNHSFKIPVPNCADNLKDNKTRIEICVDVLPFLNIISKIFNFSLTFTNEHHSTLATVSLIKSITMQLKTNQIQMAHSVTRINVYGTNVYGNDYVIGRCTTNGKRVFIVPLIPKSELRICQMIIPYVILFPSLIFFFYITAYMLKLPSNQWTILDIYQVILGVSKSQPLRFVERILFFTLTLLSMDFAVDFLSTLTDIKIAHEMEHFDTFEDIIRSNLTVYSYSQIEGEVNDLNLKKILSNTKMIPSAKECLRMLLHDRNIICIASYRRAMAELYNTDAGSLIQISKPTFDQCCEVFI